MKDDSTPARTRGQEGRETLEDLKRSREAFVEPFRPLLDQVQGARNADVYPFYETLDPLSSRHRLRQPVILVQNDYLGLSGDERIREAGRRAISRFGSKEQLAP